MNSSRRSLTIRSNEIQSRRLSTCRVYALWTPERAKRPPPRRQYKALWDTGAMNSMVTERVVDDLSLPVEGFTRLLHVGGIQERVPQFRINLAVFADLRFPGVEVVSGKLTGCDVLIGMDIINRGDFAVSNRNGATTFSFRIPSVEDFDFVQADAARKN